MKMNNVLALHKQAILSRPESGQIIQWLNSTLSF